MKEQENAAQKTAERILKDPFFIHAFQTWVAQTDQGAPFADQQFLASAKTYHGFYSNAEVRDQENLGLVIAEHTGIATVVSLQ